MVGMSQRQPSNAEGDRTPSGAKGSQGRRCTEKGQGGGGGGAAVSDNEGDEGDAEELAAGVNHKHCSVSLPHSLTLSLTTTHTPLDSEALRIAIGQVYNKQARFATETVPQFRYGPPSRGRSRDPSTEHLRGYFQWYFT